MTVGTSDHILGLVGVSLLHFLWQGALIALALRVILSGCLDSRARYGWAFASLVLMATTPIANLWVAMRLSATGGLNLGAPLGDALPALAGWKAWLACAWLVGVGVFSLRAILSLRALSVLRAASQKLSDDMAWRCRLLAERMAPGWRVKFRLSADLDSPVVIGWLRPMVLIPLSALTRTSREELEALILHELAHVRRLDAFANLLQAAVEIMLFYHPAVWWVSKVMRTEREHCCDDLAVAATGDPARYVRALANMEEARRINALALGAAGGSLVMRARRQLTVADVMPDRVVAMRMTAGALLLTLVVMASGLLGQNVRDKTLTSLTLPVHTLTLALSVPSDPPPPAVSTVITPPAGTSVAAQPQPRPELMTMGAVPVETLAVPTSEPAPVIVPSLPIEAPVAEPTPDLLAPAARAQQIDSQIVVVRRAHWDYLDAVGALRELETAQAKTVKQLQSLAASVLYDAPGHVSDMFRSSAPPKLAPGTQVTVIRSSSPVVDEKKLATFLASAPAGVKLAEQNRQIEQAKRAIMTMAEKELSARDRLNALMAG